MALLLESYCTAVQRKQNLQKPPAIEITLWRGVLLLCSAMKV